MTDAEGPTPGSSASFEGAKEVWKYLQTVQGVGSAAPAGVVVADFFANLLPISAAVKPEVYLLALVGVAYAFQSEAARYVLTVPASPEYGAMSRRGNLYFGLFAGASVVYLVAAKSLGELLPANKPLRWLLIYLTALLLVLAMTWITKALVIFGLRVYVAQHRSPGDGGAQSRS